MAQFPQPAQTYSSSLRSIDDQNAEKIIQKALGGYSVLDDLWIYIIQAPFDVLMTLCGAQQHFKDSVGVHRQHFLVVAPHVCIFSVPLTAFLSFLLSIHSVGDYLTPSENLSISLIRLPKYGIFAVPCSMQHVPPWASLLHFGYCLIRF
eukprot:Gb_08369 [translate_table: standard]